MTTDNNPLQPLTPARHGAEYWRVLSNFSFMAAEAVVPVSAPELNDVVVNYPMAFAMNNDVPMLTAVFGLEPGKNVYVSPQGEWLGSHLPLAVQTKPFVLLPTENNGYTLFVDERLCNNGVNPAEPFFDGEGNLGPEVKRLMDIATQVERTRPLINNACLALQKHGLIQPWKLTVTSDDGVKEVGGLFQVGEQLLRELGAEALVELRDSGALMVAYAQLLSMKNIGKLAKLAQERLALELAAAAAAAPAEKSFFDGDTLKF